jgi:hypothetical protein
MSCVDCCRYVFVVVKLLQILKSSFFVCNCMRRREEYKGEEGSRSHMPGITGSKIVRTPCHNVCTRKVHTALEVLLTQFMFSLEFPLSSVVGSKIIKVAVDSDLRSSANLNRPALVGNFPSAQQQVHVRDSEIQPPFGGMDIPVIISTGQGRCVEHYM